MDCAAPKLSPPELAAQVGEQEISWQEKNVFFQAEQAERLLFPVLGTRCFRL